MKQPELWAQLEAAPMELNGQPLAEALVKSENWSKRKAQKAVEEYRKFLYLTQIADTDIAPSGPVDLVWVRHMTSASYSQQVLPLLSTREPVRFVIETQANIRRNFSMNERAKTYYRTEFSAQPPESYWPDVVDQSGNLSLDTLAMVCVAMGSLFCAGLIRQNVIEGIPLWLPLIVFAGTVGLAWRMGKFKGSKNTKGRPDTPGFGGSE